MTSAILSVGIGRVGLPLSLRLWDAGHDVALVDIDGAKIDMLRQRRMPFLEQGCAEILARTVEHERFHPLTYDDEDFASRVGAADYIVLTLGTPLGTDYTFRFDQYFDVLDRIVAHLRRGVTLVVRSTVAPHFTRNVVTPRIQGERDWIPGIDFFPSFCPERLVQGQALADIDVLPEIIGADDTQTAARAATLFRSINPHKVLHHVSTVEAELAKLYLNAFRYTLFGLANEFALVAEQYGANVYRILDAANGDYPRGSIPRPGPSRGPCLGKDTATLAFSTTSGLIVHAALKTHENVVLHVGQELRATLGSLAGQRVTVLGLAFKPETDDVRDNMTAPLINLLDREGAVTAVYDPLVAGDGDTEALCGSDAVVLMTPHRVLVDLTPEDLAALCERPRGEIFVYDLWGVWPWADRNFGKGSDDSDENLGNRRLRLAHARGHSASAWSGARRTGS